MEDKLQWTPENRGNFTVKSAYMEWLVNAYNLQQVEGWRGVWNAPVIPKVKHFLWRIFVGLLPTKSELFRRHVTVNDLCPMCGDGRETVDHTLL